MNFVNLTPHAIILNDGRRFEATGNVARVSADLAECATGNGTWGPRMFRQTFGDVTGLPDPVDGTMFIVSGLVFSATDRTDVVAPATSHKDVVRNEAGQIVSVPGFIVK